MGSGNIDLQGRVALVTGASRGIGAAVAQSLARHGASIAVHYGSDEKAAQNVNSALAGEGHICLGADLANPQSAANLPSQVADALGRLDIVVNNAGIFEEHAIQDPDPAQWRAAWDKTLAVNLDAPAHIIQGAVPLMARNGGGHIVNVTSRGAYRGEPDAPAYGAAKAGLNSLTQSLARKLAPQGIHLVGVAPGWVRTDMTMAHLDGPKGAEIRDQSPLGRTASPEEIAEVVLLAASGRADALTGSIIDVNCGSYFR